MSLFWWNQPHVDPTSMPIDIRKREVFFTANELQKKTELEFAKCSSEHMLSIMKVFTAHELTDHQPPSFRCSLSYRPHDAPLCMGDRAFPVTAAWAWNALRHLFILRHRCCSSAATSRRHCFSHCTLHHSVQLCNYNLRPRRHNLVLTAKSSSITDRDYITRMIFKNI